MATTTMDSPLHELSTLPDDAAAQLSGESQAQTTSHSKRNLTNEERAEMAAFLLKHSQEDGRLPRSALTAAADKFKVHRNTASRIWNLMKPALERGAVAEALTVSVLSRKRGNCGRKKKDYSAAMAQVKQLPVDQRGSLRALSSAVGVPRTTLFRLLREEDTKTGVVNSESSPSIKMTIIDAIKAPLSEKNKRERLRFCYNKVRPNGLFDDMYNVVHINTKMCSVPNRDGKKTKVVFLVAVARPQWDEDRQQQFDGKLGIWPFLVAEPPLPIGTYAYGDTEAEQEEAPRPDRVFHVMENVTKKEIQAMITAYVIPAIKLKMPLVLRDGPVFIQLDNYQLRLAPDDPVVAEHGSTDGWNIVVQYQPAYSPDLIVLDHSLLKCIDSDELMAAPLQMNPSRMSPIEALIVGVERSFAAVPKSRITDAFLTLQKTMEATMLAGGSNDYEAQGETTKKRLKLDGSVPVSVLCKPDAIMACRAVLLSSTAPE